VIPVHEPLLGGRELDYVSDCVRTGWISSAGEFIERFEEDWAAYCDRKYGVAVSNGTVALQLALACLDLEPGDEVIMPTFTIISCALAAIRVGAIPVLVDADPRSWGMVVEQVREKITSRTRVIMPVHVYGHPVDMDPLLGMAREHGLAIVEDAAEAHGAEYLVDRNGPAPRWRRCGGFGDLSCFSFYSNKLVTTGEGGMIVTDDPRLAERARSLRNLAFQPERRFLHDEAGFNFRMTNLQAALGVAQVERIDEILARKRAMAAGYNRRLDGIGCLELPVEERWARNAFWMYALVLSEESPMDAVELARELRARGVDTRPFFLGMHEQPVFHRLGLFRDEAYPTAERIARRGLYLPSGPGLTDDQLDRVAGALREVLA